VTEVVIMMGGFLLILFLGIPIGVAMGITGVLTILVTGSTTAFFQAIAQKMYTGIDSFALMAIPFFLLAGNLMDRGGISRRLIGFFKLLLRRVPATTAIITSVSSAFFGALTGSAPATVAAIGGITIPIMEKEGYKKGDATAIAAASGILGPIIPPSITMITYGVCASVSVSTMFLAGLIPGILITVGYITVELIRYGRLERGHKEKLPRGAVWDSFKKALLALGMPLIILGGIYGGFFTPTEAAVVSCFYALIVSGVVYKEIRWKDLPGILYTSAKSTAMILFILCMASGYAWLMTNFGLIDLISAY
jgi:C4-dicarboxylate transporter DctM subunit